MVMLLRIPVIRNWCVIFCGCITRDTNNSSNALLAEEDNKPLEQNDDNATIDVEKNTKISETETQIPFEQTSSDKPEVSDICVRPQSDVLTKENFENEDLSNSIKSLQLNAEKYRQEIRMYQENPSIRKYNSIEESLMRIQIKLDKLPIDHSQPLCEERKQVIKNINKLLKTLDDVAEHFRSNNENEGSKGVLNNTTSNLNNEGGVEISESDKKTNNTGAISKEICVNKRTIFARKTEGDFLQTSGVKPGVLYGNTSERGQCEVHTEGNIENSIDLSKNKVSEAPDNGTTSNLLGALHKSEPALDVSGREKVTRNSKGSTSEFCAPDCASDTNSYAENLERETEVPILQTTSGETGVLDENTCNKSLTNFNEAFAKVTTSINNNQSTTPIYEPDTKIQNTESEKDTRNSQLTDVNNKSEISTTASRTNSTDTDKESKNVEIACLQVDPDVFECCRHTVAESFSNDDTVEKEEPELTVPSTEIIH